MLHDMFHADNTKWTTQEVWGGGNEKHTFNEQSEISPVLLPKKILFQLNYIVWKKILVLTKHDCHQNLQNINFMCNYPNLSNLIRIVLCPLFIIIMMSCIVLLTLFQYSTFIAFIQMSIKQDYKLQTDST